MKYKKILSLLLLCFVSVYMIIPAEAAITCYNPKNWIDDIVFNGDTKLVKYHIAGNESFFDLRFYTGNGYQEIPDERTTVTGTSYVYKPPAESIRHILKLYTLGVCNPMGAPLQPYSSVYVGDFMTGAQVDISLQYRATVKLTNVVDNACFLSWNTYLYRYDKDGIFIDFIKFETSNESVLSSSGTINIDASYAYEREAIDYYICPVIEVTFNHAKNSDATFEIGLLPWDFRFSVATNMIYENSQTMQDITDTLGDISDKIDDTNEKIDESNSLLGQIGDSIASLPQKIGDTITDLFVPSEGKLQDAAGQAEQLIDDHLGAAAQAGDYVTELAGAFTKQDTQDVIQFPAVNLVFSGVPWSFGGWNVDVVPDGFEFLVDILATIIDIVATLAFINAFKSRLEKILDGGG